MISCFCFFPSLAPWASYLAGLDASPERFCSYAARSVGGGGGKGYLTGW
jgi:hypothetical protein